MTRREEIEKAANEFYKGDEVSTFVVAAQWADKTMLKRMLKYLKVEHPTFFEHFGEEIRKAMEE